MVYARLARLGRFCGRMTWLATRVATWPLRKGRVPNSTDVRAGWNYVRNFCRGHWLAPFALPATLDQYAAWVANHPWNARTAASAELTMASLQRRPRFSVVMPVYNVADCWLEKAIASVQAQVYPDWELCVADDASTWPNVRPTLRRYAAADSRIRLVERGKNGHISRATNSAAELATGEFLVFLDQDDELTPDCLLELARAAVAHADADLLYSDDDKIDDQGKRYHPQFKPDWSPELLLSYMYFGHVFAVRRSLFEAVGGLRTGFEGSQDYDLALRVSERARRIVHVPAVLYHWRSLPSSTASSGNAKPAAFERGIRAVQEALSRRKVAGTVSRPDWAVRGHLGLFQLDFPNYGPRVTIVIPTRNRVDLLKRCIDSIGKLTTYPNYRILVIDNESDDPATLAYLDNLPANCASLWVPSDDGRFNFARLNNRAVDTLESEFILFLNNDTEVRRPEWLSQLVGYAQFPGVGAVGGRLLYPDDRVQHAGVVIGLHNGLAGHAFKLCAGDDNGYLSYAAVARNYSAVTAACLLVRRTLFQELGGFDEQRYAVAYNDVDFCLRLGARGLRCVYAPRAELTHYEGVSRGFTDQPQEREAFRTQWGRRPDPYYSPHLSLDDEQFHLNTARMPAELPEIPRVLLFTHNLNLEGAPLTFYEKAAAMQQRGQLRFEVCSPLDGPLAERFRQVGIPVHLFESPLAEITRPGYLQRVAELTAWIEAQKFDLAWANTLLTFYVVEAARRAVLPCLWSLHESADWKTYFDQFGPEIPAVALTAFAAAYRVVFCANATRTLFESLNTRHNFSTIPPVLLLDEIDRYCADWSPTRARAAIGCRLDRQVVTIVGTVCARKGQLDFVRAALSVLRSGRDDVEFYLVGCQPATEEVDEYQRQVAAEAAEFPEQLLLIEKTELVYHYLRSSTIAVCSSYNESFPRVTLEALAFQVPLVSTPVFGISEQVAHEASALLYHPGDVATLVNHLERLLDDPAERGRLAENGLAALRTVPSFAETVDAHERLLLGAYLVGGPPLSAGVAEHESRPRRAA